MVQFCFEVPPRSRKSIMEAADGVRSALRITNPKFPILQVVELMLPKVMPEFSFEVKEADEMGDNHGLTHPESNEMWIRSDVYDGACQGNGRDRFTIAHELGHLLLHNLPGMARKMKPASSIKAYVNSEWQANTFAGALLIPTNIAVDSRDPYEIAEVCGVSVDAASVRLKVLSQMGLLNTGGK